MDDTNLLISIFCEIDDFCKDFERYTNRHYLPTAQSTKRGPKSGLVLSEIMTILVLFHHMRFRDFKTFYTVFVAKYWCPYFPKLPSYSRFITLMKQALIPMVIFTQIKSGSRTGIYYIDSTCLPVAHLKRSKTHKTWASIAQYGRTSVGWFFGLKLHLVINDKGELIAFKITQGNRHDAKEAPFLLKNLKGRAFGDKGYIGKKLLETLLEKGLQLITRKRKNMKKETLSNYEQQLLNQRGIIETVIGHLKHHYQVWHTRHRSLPNAVTHLVSALASYAIKPLKISAIKLLGAVI